jgi:hypothetical protein
MAVLVGLGTGISIRGVVGSEIIDQIRISMLPLWTGNIYDSFSNIMIVITVVLTLYYFIFTFALEGKGSDLLRQIARYLMMFVFGAGFANYTNSQFARLIGVVQFILYDFLGISF